jgi:hypothetical protein
MSETETITEERRSIPDFPSYLIARSGVIYSARSGKELSRPIGSVADSSVYIQHPGDEVSVRRNVAKLVKGAFNA